MIGGALTPNRIAGKGAVSGSERGTAGCTASLLERFLNGSEVPVSSSTGCAFTAAILAAGKINMFDVCTLTKNMPFATAQFCDYLRTYVFNFPLLCPPIVDWLADGMPRTVPTLE